jgi:transcription initiation factor TFIIIB Brf1 subunit/transcription initiation factor TFIIB
MIIEYRCPSCRQTVPETPAARTRCPQCGCIVERIEVPDRPEAPPPETQSRATASTADRLVAMEPLEAPSTPELWAEPPTAAPEPAVMPLFGPPVLDAEGLESEIGTAESTASAEPRIRVYVRPAYPRHERADHLPEYLKMAMGAAGPGPWTYRNFETHELWINGISLVIVDRRRKRALVVDGDMAHSKLYGPAGLMQSVYRYPRTTKHRRVHCVNGGQQS